MENQNKTIAFQWMIPTGLLMVVVVIMLFNFSSSTKTEATDTIHKDLIAATEAYRDDFLEELNDMNAIAAPVARILEAAELKDTPSIAEMTSIIAKSTNAYKVYYCDRNGEGVNQSGERISIGDTDYFQAFQKSDSLIYTCVEDGNYLNQKSVVTAVRVEKGDSRSYFLMFYSMDRFRSMLSKSDYGSRTFLAMLDAQGNVLGSAGMIESALLKNGNMLDVIMQTDKETARTIRNRMENATRGATEVTVGKENKLLVYVPIETNGWEMVLGVSMDYVDRQIESRMANANKILIRLIVVICIFACIVMVVNILGKIRSNEKKKQLEDKADTDLLTGLNNKLATERKIKEYMAQNPNSQCLMFLLDIDNFKKINDTMGHAFGDEVLRSLGLQIGAIFRASDIIGRIGGDEFMIFLKAVETKEAIQKEAKKVENFFKSFQAGEYVKYKATASIGAAIFPQEGSDFEALYKAADQGLYKAKKRGKNQLAFYKDEWMQTEQPEKKTED